MANPISDLLRLARAGLVMAEHGVRFVPKGAPVPLALRLARFATLPWQAVTWPFRALSAKTSKQARIAAALSRLGPSYIKLGQFLATRADLVGGELAGDLAGLQDKMPPFAQQQAIRAVEDALGAPVERLFVRFGPPVAAASIAQVHKAEIIPRQPEAEQSDPANIGESAAGDQAKAQPATRNVAVKVLRPSVERRFAGDLSSFYFAARQIERFHPPSRRLRPVAVVDTLAASMELELDLRMEAAAISEMAQNSAADAGFRVPVVDWQRTAKRVLTTEWIDATPMNDVAALRAAGHDLTLLGENVIRHFLRHAMRDGFFHADMHQGNLFVDADGTIVAVDFGIMGRLSSKERRFLAEILYGFITRDYRRAAEVHFWAGYVPAHHPVETFAQALRAIGEPLFDRTAEEISMGHLLGQLFQYTDVFDMQTRPELILLQKTMVVVEGVARTLDPKVNIWTAAEPVVKEWMERELGLAGRLDEAREGAGQVGQFIGELPKLLVKAERTADAFADMAAGGMRLSEDSIARIAREQARSTRWRSAALWLGALSLAALAVAQFA